VAATANEGSERVNVDTSALDETELSAGIVLGRSIRDAGLLSVTKPPCRPVSAIRGTPRAQRAETVTRNSRCLIEQILQSRIWPARYAGGVGRSTVMH
jgi:hypothetical protein